MSWMDSWSRPSKSQATPAPFYLLPNGDSTPYCRTCGRVISSRKSSTQKSDTAPRYCSARCRGQKPGRLDREIEQAFVRFLQGEEDVPDDAASPNKKKKPKGDARNLIPCDLVERHVFGERKDPEKVFGRRKNRASRVISATDEDEGVDLTEKHEQDPGEEVIDDILGRTKSSELDPAAMASLSIRSGTRVRPPQTQSQVNGSIGGEKGRAERVEETDEMREKRNEGQKKAHEREMVRCAARRGVVFGFVVGDSDEGRRRKCEAVMQGKVVEPSFAKGDWAVRWRED
ncbi:hypothetical protein CMUS01_12222 [Colletotrichum musicola]|uniref:Uncharacterized protein n=1 Tax=Colletotrichum musicola TaxID=2175873 RepID=A0A8H6N277_9PEZI|nr:hypothetical protein CMUS01_12222 [Colletotrichum musicola]